MNKKEFVELIERMMNELDEKKLKRCMIILKEFG